MCLHNIIVHARYDNFFISLKKLDLYGKGVWGPISAGTFEDFSTHPLIFHSWLVALSCAYYIILFLLFLNSSFIVYIFFLEVVHKCPQ
jgi:hypothetical protein